MAQSQVIFVFWFDKVDSGFKQEHGREPGLVGSLERDHRIKHFVKCQVELVRQGRSVFGLRGDKAGRKVRCGKRRGQISSEISISRRIRL